MKLAEQFVPPSSKLMSDYINGDENLRRYFSYNPDMSSFGSRLQKLQKHNVDRQRLSAVIRSYMEPYGISGKAEEHLQDFEDGASVVVTGQQAGILTGPLYTIHKAISAIVLAKQAKEELNTKVVPVFWIAGEDHDLAEISHLYREINGRVEKLNFPHVEYGKKTASTAILNKARITDFLNEYFRSLPETAYSKELQQMIFGFLETTETYTEFFSSLLNHFFNEEGLLMIDAAYPEMRKFESEFFKRLIELSPAIAKEVYTAEQELVAQGYNPPLSAEEDAAHLFITVKGERILLKREGETFTGNDGKVRFSVDDLLNIAEQSPEMLSNNVVTRPLMQEMVFPVLAFVGGPGEIAYWSLFKKAFEILGMEMPVIMPRLGMTLVNRKVQLLLEKYGSNFEDVAVKQKTKQLKADLLDAVREKEAEKLIEDLEAKIQMDYDSIQQRMTEVSRGLAPLVEKNLQFHLKQLDFLKHKLEDEVILQNSVQFGHYDFLENELLPNGSLQERIYNPVSYMNEYGMDLVNQLLALDLKYDKNHKIIYF
ncbi:bacillithiol biosynthesis cysteine-adding enzyme BshC [Planomicrobium okeanokoites]|uniref:Putative cysteine ligase BshC n=1 Tax=Planomicrobium okeanokoites TaxID=244 RepID=A0ABV7KNU8_PLAOK|nr:bacillithiol biosynthesis cysteine-adding enzyme BshC [Planomicrobium okeanokoites]TAA71485.1 bacillithiol biosynthesis cysteine-adding enzyme BshC [Planomicrobium okeanokoites]